MTRIGLTQRVEVVEAYGERRDCLDQAWTDLLESCEFHPVPLPNRIKSVADYLDSCSLDGIILTSGNDIAHLDTADDPAPERDQFETAVLEYALDEHVPVLGVCRGLEFLNVHFGGTLSTFEGHVADDHELLFDETESNGLELPTAVTVNSYHEFGVRPSDVADELTVLGRTPDESIECVVHDQYPVWGVMWHPERDSPSATFDRQFLNHLFEDTTR